MVSAKRLAQIREAIQVQKSPHAEMLEILKRRTSIEINREKGSPRTFGERMSILAIEAAFLFLLSEDEEYRTKAVDALRALMAGPIVEVPDEVPGEDPPERPEPQRPEAGHALTRAQCGLAFALVFDWCGQQLGAEDREWMQDVLKSSLDTWAKFGHLQLAPHRHSHWLPVCRSSELIQIIALGEHQKRSKRLEFLKEALKTHMQQTYSSHGLSQSGVEHLAHAFRYITPAILALESINDISLHPAYEKHAWWKYLMFAASNQARFGRHHYLMHGITEPITWDVGFASMAFLNCPRGFQANYKWFYDHHLGSKSRLFRQSRYDVGSAGTVWAMLLYPESIEAEAPTESFGVSLDDPESGTYFFRNQWESASDIQISLTADLLKQQTFDANEALQLNVLAHGVRYFASAGVRGHAGDYTTLLVDGKNHAPYAGTGQRYQNGAKDYFKANTDGGYVIVDGGSKYKRLGVEQNKRHLKVKFMLQNQAIFSTLDQIRSKKQHLYTWNAHLGIEALRTETGVESDRRTFTLQTRRKRHYLKGWIMHPVSARLRIAGGRLMIDTSGTNADIWIVMAMGAGSAPKATVLGSGLGATLFFGGTQVRFDADSNRILMEPGVETKP